MVQKYPKIHYRRMDLAKTMTGEVLLHPRCPFCAACTVASVTFSTPSGYLGSFSQAICRVIVAFVPAPASDR
jgi:hypothetical protein